jgi:hypothetical protein
MALSTRFLTHSAKVNCCFHNESEHRSKAAQLVHHAAGIILVCQGGTSNSSERVPTNVSQDLPSGASGTNVATKYQANLLNNATYLLRSS